MLCRILAILALASSAFAQNNSGGVPRNPDWFKPFPPFKIIGNIYWVGTYDLSTYLITTPQGNILINTGFVDTVPKIKEGVEKLGFKLSDTKIIMATHGHIDHVAGVAELKRQTHAKVIVSEAGRGSTGRRRQKRLPFRRWRPHPVRARQSRPAPEEWRQG